MTSVPLVSASLLNLKPIVALMRLNAIYATTKTNILIGDKRHWRTINKTLCTFLTSKKLLDLYWENFLKNCEDRHDPFEKYINEIYKKEFCISP